MVLRPNAKTEVRRNRYKVAEEERRTREDNMVEIRKSKRKGMQDLQDFPPSSTLLMPPPSIRRWINSGLERLSDIVAGVWSDDPCLQLESTTQFRKLLSIERSPPIEEVIRSGVVPRFVEFLKEEDNPQLQFEATWSLTNIASGTSDHTKVVIDHNAVPIFVKLLASPSDDVREQAVWALGNVAWDSPQCRDLVLTCGALKPLLNLLNEHAKLSMLRNATWTLSNLCRGSPQPYFEQVKPALPALGRLIHSDDEEVLTDACWALENLSNGTNDKIQTVIEAGVVPRLVELLGHPCPSVLIPALDSVSNIVSGDDEQTTLVVNSGAVPLLAKLLSQNYEKHIKLVVCHTISNISCVTKLVQTVIDANLIPPLVSLLQNPEFDLKKEAAWGISNTAVRGYRHNIKYLVEQGFIKPLCDLLVCPDPIIVNVCLEAFLRILEGGCYCGNDYTLDIEDAQGLEKIKKLKSHDNREICEMALLIRKRFWFEDDEFEDDETQQPPGVNLSWDQAFGLPMRSEMAIPGGRFRGHDSTYQMFISMLRSDGFM